MREISKFLLEQFPFMWGGENTVRHEVRLFKVMYIFTIITLFLSLAVLFPIFKEKNEVEELRSGLFTLHYAMAFSMSIIVLFYSYRKGAIRVKNNMMCPPDLAFYMLFIGASLIFSHLVIKYIFAIKVVEFARFVFCCVYPIFPALTSLYFSRTLIIQMLSFEDK